VKMKKTGEAMGIGVVFGVILFVLTDEPFWIAVGVALGAAYSTGRSRGETDKDEDASNE
jgi:uncharacterized protein DUF543